MTDAGFRDLGTLVPGLTPAAPPVQSAPAPAPAGRVAPALPQRLFVSDVPHGADALAHEDPLGHLAALATHSASEAPFAIALLGSPGSGKSFALGRLIAAIRQMSQGAQGNSGAFLSKVATIRIDAADLDGDPAIALAAKVHAGLVGEFPDLAREATHAVRDPRIAVRETSERLDEARRRLDTERRALDEVDSRRARLAETVLYETPGSQVDTYARTNRSRIEGRLTAFGIAGEPIRTYKDIVRGIGESNGASAKLGIGLRAFWAFKGQTRLIVTAILLVLVSFGLGVAITNQATWLAWLRTTNEAMVPVAAWFQTHMNWLATLQQAAWIAACVAVAANIWRALRFLQPLYRGASLLRGDLANRRRDLDAAYAHQTRRVDGLAADVEGAARRAADAERRFGALGAAAVHTEPPPFETDAGRAQAAQFFNALAAFVAAKPGDLPKAIADGGAPQRIIVALDDLDAVPPARMRAILDAAHRLLAGSGFVTLVAADPTRLLLAAHPAELEKWFQIPFRVEGTATPNYAELVQTLLHPTAANIAATGGEMRTPKIDATISTVEADLLTELAPLAGRSPRALKRFVNLYRLARLQLPEHSAVVALMLALDGGGTPAEVEAASHALAAPDHEAGLDLRAGGPRLTQALAAVEALEGPVSLATARLGAAIASRFSLRQPVVA